MQHWLLVDLHRRLDFDVEVKVVLAFNEHIAVCVVLHFFVEQVAVEVVLIANDLHILQVDGVQLPVGVR